MSVYKPGTILNGLFEVTGIIERNDPIHIYAARELGSNRKRILKLLSCAPAQPEAAAIHAHRIDARCLSRFRHPNVLHGRDFLLSENDEPYIVLEYFEGKRLSTLVAETNGLSCLRSIYISAQICDALQAAHHNGIIMRELRPSGIFLTQCGSDPNYVKLAEFSKAIQLSDSREPLPLSPLPSEPCYTSPEILRGRKATPRSDIFSMGCLIYEILLGVPPYDVETVLSAIRENTFLRFPRFTDVRPDLSLPREVEKVVRCALERDPSDRYASMQELKDALVHASGEHSVVTLDTISRNIKVLLDRLGKSRTKTD